MGGKNRWNRKLVDPLLITFCARYDIAEKYRAAVEHQFQKASTSETIIPKPKVVTLLDPRRSIVVEPDLHIKCFDHCSEKSEDQGPTRDHIKQLIDFGKELTEDDYILVHCEAGISRSSAATIIIMVSHYGINQIGRIIPLIRAINLIAHPNRLMIRYADQMFGLKGTLNKVVQSLDRSYPNLLWNVDRSQYKSPEFLDNDLIVPVVVPKET